MCGHGYFFTFKIVKDMIREIFNWKLIDIGIGRDRINRFSFLKGWIVTLKWMIYLWNFLNSHGFEFISIKKFNQDLIGKLFCLIRQYC